MKQEKHENRKSFSKWAMPWQREQTQSAEALDLRRIKALAQGRKTHLPNIGRNNGPLKHSAPAQMESRPPAFVRMIKSRDGFLPRDVGRSNGGAKVASRGNVIPSYAYCPRGY